MKIRLTAKHVTRSKSQQKSLGGEAICAGNEFAGQIHYKIRVATFFAAQKKLQGLVKVSTGITKLEKRAAGDALNLNFKIKR